MDMIDIDGAAKTFILHNQAGARIEALSGVRLTVRAGECVALTGESGAGKSTLMRMVYGNYLTGGGSIRVRHDGMMLNVAEAEPRAILAMRRKSLGYVSQFLRVIPRISALRVVAEPLIALGENEAAAMAAARAMLSRLRVKEALWDLPPATFSGGEQQRVNLARGFLRPWPAMLVDEPTASLDAVNRETALALIREAKGRGAAILGIFHDAAARAAVCDREYAL